MKGLIRFDKAARPKGVSNKAQKHVTKRAIFPLTKVINVFLQRQYFPLAWKQVRVVSVLKPGQDSKLASS